MTLVEELVFTLSKNERTRLRPLQFRGAKRDIIFKILECRSRNGINAASIKRRHKLTDVRYYQVLSEMLHTMYEEVAPGDGITLLEFLGRKQLYRHFLREIRSQESDLLEAGDTAALAEYYLQVLVLSSLQMFPLNTLPDLSDELHGYVKRYVKYKTPHPHDKYLVRVYEISDRLGKLLEKTIRRDKLDPYVHELESIFRRTRTSSQFLVRFNVCFTLMIIFARIYYDRGKALRYIAYAKQLVRDHADIFGDYAALFELVTDLHDLSSRQQQTERVKKFLIAPEHGENLSSIRYLERYLPMIIVSGEHEWVKAYARDHFPEQLGLVAPDASVHYAMILTLLRISDNDLAAAEESLAIAMRANTGRHRNMYSEMQLRCYDAFLMGMRHNPLVAEESVQRHMRYMRRQVQQPQDSNLLIFLNAMRELLRGVEEGKGNCASIFAEFRQKYRGHEQFVFLFERLCAKFRSLG
ncbi:MAG: hypothetical protein JSS75_04215 [Bacteroidetes bacterium]|nr:hypothetical protein [Bacteroidota bacterium]